MEGRIILLPWKRKHVCLSSAPYLAWLSTFHPVSPNLDWSSCLALSNFRHAMQFVFFFDGRCISRSGLSLQHFGTVHFIDTGSGMVFFVFGVIDCEPEFIFNSLLLNLFDLDDSWVLRTVPCHSKQSTATVVMMRATQVQNKSA